MFVPLISTPAAQLAKRKGGGGGGKGGGGGSSGGKSGSGGSSSGKSSGSGGGASSGSSKPGGGSVGSSGGSSSDKSSGSGGGASSGSSKPGGGSVSSTGGSSSDKSSGSGGKASSGSSQPGGSSVGSTSHVPVSNLPAGKSSATAYGSGGGRPVTIPAGQPFAGRTMGGGTRNQVYGNTFYGSGYPGASGLGVAGHGLPFAFWPIVWGGAAGIGAGAYLHEAGEYGDPNNSSRPGGPMTQAHFVSNVTGSSFHVLSDNTTLASLIASIQPNCTAFDLNNSSSSSTPASYNGSNPSDPQPESAIQYYRASSVVLTLDGYNNTAAINGSASNVNATPAALPSGIDTTLLNCLNDTIGQSVPLVDAGVHWGPPQMSLLYLAWLAWMFSRSVL